jgi:hypothetical protein
VELNVPAGGGITATGATGGGTTAGGGGVAGTVVDCVVVVSVSVCAIATLLVRANATTEAHKKLLITASIKSQRAHSNAQGTRAHSGSTHAITPTFHKGCSWVHSVRRSLWRATRHSSWWLVSKQVDLSGFSRPATCFAGPTDDVSMN